VSVVDAEVVEDDKTEDEEQTEERPALAKPQEEN
jgi:hypothetical protein